MATSVETTQDQPYGRTRPWTIKVFKAVFNLLAIALVMFEHLLLNAKRAFNGGSLNDLGQITVICGKNNSGKSTILEAIADEKGLWLGKRLSPQQIKEFTDNVISFDFKSQAPNDARILAGHIQQIFATRDIWHKNDLSIFSDLYQNRPPQLRRWQLSTPTTHFNNLFPEKAHVALITAKRKLEIQANVIVQDFRFDATGILSHLYWLKNSSPGSSERGQYDIISGAFEELSDGYLFNLRQEKNGMIFLVFSRDNKIWHNAADCGLGLHELLVILFFCHATTHDLVLVEEIENHLHPYMQKKLLRYLKSVKGKQFILSTHSSAFLDTSVADRIYYATNDGEVRLQEVTNRAEVLKNLGYSISDNIVSDLIILIEGPTDAPVIEELLIKKGTIPRFDIKMWALGGDIMHHHDLEVFKQHYQVMALIDNDPKSNKCRKAFLAKCKELKIPAVRLKGYSIENYFSPNALMQVFGNQITPNLAIKRDIKLESQIGFSVKHNNRKIARAMSLQDLSGTDLDAFLDQAAEACKALYGEKDAVSTEHFNNIK